MKAIVRGFGVLAVLAALVGPAPTAVADPGHGGDHPGVPVIPGPPVAEVDTPVGMPFSSV